MNSEKTKPTDIKHQAVKESMKDWFLNRYEDPAENTPYDSSEGGFLYIWGGPCEPRDVIYEEFSEKVDNALIEEVIEDLESVREEWARIPTIDDFDPIDLSSEFLARFNNNIGSIRKELSSVNDKKENHFLCSLLFTYTITSLEAYLSDAFLTCMKTPIYFRAFIESDPELKKEKLSVSDIYNKLETLNSDAFTRIQAIVFHRLDIVQRMYRDSLGVEFPSGMRDLLIAISKRHDIIHRGCRDKEGNTFSISKDDVKSLLALIEKFVFDLESKISELAID